MAEHKTTVSNTAHVKLIDCLINLLRKLRNKGEDDKMPPLKKKQREIMHKFQNEQV